MSDTFVLDFANTGQEIQDAFARTGADRRADQ